MTIRALSRARARATGSQVRGSIPSADTGVGEEKWSGNDVWAPRWTSQPRGRERENKGTLALARWQTSSARGAIINYLELNRASHHLHRARAREPWRKLSGFLRVAHAQNLLRRRA